MNDAQKKTAIFLEVEPWEKAFLRKICPPAWQTLFYPDEADRIDPKKIAAVEILSVFIYSDLTADLLKKMPKLKMIATRSTGFDHIDVAYCREKGISVSNVPSYGANTVAEHAFALILSLSRKIYPARERTLHGDFSFHGLQGFDLMGKTLGVIGTGQIGRHAIRIARGFQMQVLAYDPFPERSLSELLEFTYVPLEELLKSADVITLHSPLSEQSHHLIGKSAFNVMKKGVLLINTARGALAGRINRYRCPALGLGKRHRWRGRTGCLRGGRGGSRGAGTAF